MTATCNRIKRQPATDIPGSGGVLPIMAYTGRLRPLRLWLHRLHHQIRHFVYTANSKDHRRKIIEFERKSFTRQNSPIQKFSDSKFPGTFNSGFSMFNLRRRDQTGEFLYQIRPLVCKRQKQSGTKRFQICHERGKISSSVNLV